MQTTPWRTLSPQAPFYLFVPQNVDLLEEYQQGWKVTDIFRKQGQYVEGVPPEVWRFQVGGYQPCQKWLKDRAGRKLTCDDLTHYQRIVVALKETIRLMAEIDATIPAWPIK